MKCRACENANGTRPACLIETVPAVLHAARTQPGYAVFLTDCRHGAVVSAGTGTGTGTETAAAVEASPNPIPRDQWPMSFALVARLARPEDRGVGDTVARVIGPIGGETFKRWYKAATGHDCGCGERQEWLNQTYPY